MVKMPPREFKSSIPGLVYPYERDQLIGSGERWLKSRRKDDFTGGLWRVHDKLYDLTEFISKHPGGPDWLTASKGTDITEAFESCHIKISPDKLLQRYYIKDAETPRNFPFTFHADGFYKTLKKGAKEVLKDQPNTASLQLRLIIDSLALLFLSSFIGSCVYRSYLLVIVSGVFLAMTGMAAHNFFHRRDNFRMYYFDLLLISSYDWRITHGLSHHLYPNSVQDIEVSVFEPLLEFLPSSDATWTRRLCMLIYAHALYPLLFLLEFIKKGVFIMTGESRLRLENLLPITELLLAWYLTGEFIAAVYLWLVLHSACSYWFSLIGLAAAHHHPEIFHDGDQPRKDMDWGLYQVDAVRDRYDVSGSLFLVVTMFGDHTLHHLFPTLDHSLLPQLYPVLRQTLKEFGIPWKMYSWWDLFVGEYKQLIRTQPNPLPPWHK